MKTILSLNEIKNELIPALHKVYNWLTYNKLSLNTVKTEFMIFGTANGLNKFDNCLASKPYLISSVPDEILTWEKHIEYTKYISQN